MAGDKSLPEIDLSQALLDIQGDKTEMDKVLELMLDPKFITHLTELNRNEITAFSVLSTIDRRYRGLVIGQFLKENLGLRVSKGRKGRLEFTKITSRQLSLAEQMMQQENMPGGGRFSRFFKRRK